MWFDQIFERLANWIINTAIPAVKAFSADYFSNTIFHTMTTEELQIYFLKIALEAICIAILIKIGSSSSRKRKKMKKSKPIKRAATPSQKWSPTGWYWNEKEGLWEPPDYIVKESHERWRYDKVRGIWIDLNEEKE